MYKYVRNIYKKYKHARYLTIDPGMRNIGWCFACYSPYKLIEIDSKSYEKEIDENDNDVRMVYLSNLIEKIIIRYRPDFVVIEKISFVTGKYSFSENLLIKAIGIIESTILSNNVDLIRLGNKTSQSILLGKSVSKSNKEKMYEYVLQNKNIFTNKYIAEQISKKKYRDITDAMFISYAIYMSVIEYKKLYDL